MIINFMKLKPLKNIDDLLFGTKTEQKQNKYNKIK